MSGEKMRKRNERSEEERKKVNERETCMTSRVLMMSMGIITVTLAAAATAPSTKETYIYCSIIIVNLRLARSTYVRKRWHGYSRFSSNYRTHNNSGGQF